MLLIQKKNKSDFSFAKKISTNQCSWFVFQFLGSRGHKVPGSIILYFGNQILIPSDI